MAECRETRAMSACLQEGLRAFACCAARPYKARFEFDVFPAVSAGLISVAPKRAGCSMFRNSCSCDQYRLVLRANIFSDVCLAWHGWLSQHFIQQVQQGGAGKRLLE